ncbi:hypothetical protein [Streptomyces hokutonensis]|uniref:hypothetical protein n=1 Tax=Streptomyces hokutonensis TaxID=1306990 RepID=UPI00131A1A3D|nr:hypothetical protein [Streptomyces hokutonensis]
MKQLIIRVDEPGGETDLQAGFSSVSLSGLDGGMSLDEYARIEGLFIELFNRTLDGVGAETVVVAEPTLDGPAPAWIQKLRNGSGLTRKQAESILRGMLRGNRVGCVMEVKELPMRISVGFDFGLTVDLAEELLGFIEELLPTGLHVALAQEFPAVGLETRVADDKFWSEAFSAFPSSKILIIEKFAYGRFGENWYWALPGDLSAVRGRIGENSLVMLVEFPDFESFVPGNYFDELTIESVNQLDVRYFRFSDNQHDLSVRPLLSTEFSADPALWDARIWLVPANLDFAGEKHTAVLPDRDGRIQARWLA